MVVSSNTLFHYTGSFDTIVKILESKGFWPRYCIEFGWHDNANIDFAVPQCCFCDIPLSSVHNHMKLYGDYGIGMTKEWAISNSLSPVMYVIHGSYFTKIINGIRKKASGTDENRKFLAFIKPYQAVNYRKKDGKWDMTKQYLYYNEREWRYVPSSLKAEDLVITVKDKETFDTETISEKTKAYLCEFKAEDIRYLIVKNDTERINLISEIRKLSKWSEDEKELACSKILTHALIKEDI